MEALPLISPKPYQALRAEKCPLIECYFDRDQTNTADAAKAGVDCRLRCRHASCT
jgi:hypothetical protein